jgi:hypothetical protein
LSQPLVVPEPGGSDWIDQLSDSECMEIFWLYVDPPEPFLARHPPPLLGQAMRFALKAVAGGSGVVSGTR